MMYCSLYILYCRMIDGMGMIGRKAIFERRQVFLITALCHALLYNMREYVNTGARMV